MSAMRVPTGITVNDGTFTFTASDTGTEVRCYGTLETYAFFYYQVVNGRLREISRRRLGIPRLTPCYPTRKQGCVVWRWYRGKRYAYEYTGKGFRRTRYAVPLDVIVRVHRVVYTTLNGRPRCYTVIDNERQDVDSLSVDVSATVKYEKKKKDKGQHNFYLECHCGEDFNVYAYDTARALLNDIADAVDGCMTCIHAYLADTGLEFAFELMDGSFNVNYMILAQRPRPGCGYGHYLEELELTERCEP